ncbi:MSHA biogenesis protein MshF [Vibrio neptunius]|uniref:hypothetical protein n=1 Tax=Vibrio neptunius TaxID=170651 RepID=UPI0005F9E3A7|nr:hypothetical protein [Vibrio neptunius]KJY92125.1 MSHA biogenesis protein MshF [Vibrio neptunius]
MAGGIQRSRLVVWLSTIIILLLSFVLVLEKLEQDVDDAAFLLASKRIIERASFYKQQWMLKGQRESLIVENQSLVFSETGWVLPKMSEKNKQCMAWLSLLYPKLSILDSMPLKVVNRSELNNYQCDYVYTQGKSIHIQLVDNTFTVSVGFSST